MTKIQAQLEKSLASARALAKVAGEDCSVEKGKDPEALIDGAADVEVVDNQTAGVTVPGTKGLEVSGETSEDRGTDIGHVETNGPAPEDNKDNPEVEDIINAAEHVTKHASALIEMANHILAIPDTAFAGVAKQASAGVTEDDVLDYIVKQANAGDPAMQGIINFCEAFYKQADAGEDALAEEAAADESVAESANIEAEIAEAQEIVAKTLKEQDPSLSDEEAQEVAAQAISETLQEAGGEEASAAELDENLVGLIAQVADEVKAADPSVSDEEAAEIAIQAISEVAEEGGFDKEASAEEEVPEEAAVAEADAEDAVAPEEVEALAEQLVTELANEIKAEDPSVSDEEAIEAAADSVKDALETVQAQQLVGATDEEGAPVVSDEDAAAITDELQKSASAYPCRALLCHAINTNLGLSPEAFAARIGA